MGSLLLDTHVVHWWSAEPERVSKPAKRALEAADEFLVAAVTWYELAWLARRGRIALDVPIRTWLDHLSAQLRTIGINPAIADTAVALGDPFPGDPADRLIYATAIHQGVRLVTKDGKIAAGDSPRSLVVW
ncbi:MAG TPA: type II toxin-antitoxin system VapC family toxin [Solirubrobacterales bacterium]|nr:type II toxin-antitoxin system VapC family toxin [Solirubrobacterales bacterium]